MCYALGLEIFLLIAERQREHDELHRAEWRYCALRVVQQRSRRLVGVRISKDHQMFKLGHDIFPSVGTPLRCPKKTFGGSKGQNLFKDFCSTSPSIPSIAPWDQRP